jgi:hypothetical protein
MEKKQLKQLIKEEIKNILQESINMDDVYFILKTYKFNPKITDGNRITGIKTIDFGTYDEKTGEDAGRLRIDSGGTLYGQDLWGMNIKNADEILDAIEKYRESQRELKNSKRSNNI